MRLLFVIALSLISIRAAAQPAKTGPATAAVQQADARINKLFSRKAPAANVAPAVSSLIGVTGLLQKLQNKLQQIQSTPAAGSATPASGTAPTKPSKP